MSTTVQTGGFQITSNHESADAMVASLTPKSDDPSPRVLVDKGQPVEEAKPKDGLSKAASELGKKGGAATAKARKDAKADTPAEKPAKDAKPAAEEPAPKKGAEDEPDEKPAAGEPSKDGKPRHDPNARIAQVIRERDEERAARHRETAELRQRLQALEGRGGQPAGAQPQPGAQPGAERAGAQPAQPQHVDPRDPEPEEGDYEFHKDYVKALASWQYRQEQREAHRQTFAHSAAAKHAEATRGLLKGWTEALAAAEVEDAEFRDRVKPVLAQLPRPSRLLMQGERADAANWITDQLMSAPGKAPALLLYFAEHPEELQRIATLSSPREVTWELASIYRERTDAATAGASSEREISQARTPFRPVNGSPHTAEPDVHGEMNFDQFMDRKHRATKRA